ncbi:PREDICTED: fas apoptotic inhibitory molecule 1 isoform X1 [Polistes canadensis]|uniref:fas apoptotic inhibitory molecule 1 isoform X1 n=1 Tax=Polistes canadensis TaxID=91411 RepID=UPI000718FAEB|nr:PREDICTED: fas apoptotic inhibitory molecule 1 isoform X1 [Polistes canadensis]
MANALLRSLHALESSNEPTARWTVPLNDGNHVIEFEHGTATGRRIVKIDDEELVRREWMFRLVGDELFTFNGTKFVIRVDPIPELNFAGFKYSYTLWVNGKNYKNFVQSQSKILKSWLTKIGDNEYRILLDKQTQNVWINGELIDVENEFMDGGAEMLFSVSELPAVIRSSSSNQKEIGIDYILYIDDIEINEEGISSYDET